MFAFFNVARNNHDRAVVNRNSRLRGGSVTVDGAAGRDPHQISQCEARAGGHILVGLGDAAGTGRKEHARALGDLVLAGGTAVRPSPGIAVATRGDR